jgi:hypothetical protein
MPRTMVGLLAAVAVAMSALVSCAHGDLVWVIVTAASGAAGLVAYATAPYETLQSVKKKACRVTQRSSPKAGNF